MFVVSCVALVAAVVGVCVSYRCYLDVRRLYLDVRRRAEADGFIETADGWVRPRPDEGEL